MRSPIKKLLVIAHPDDEIIFFSQVLIPNASETLVVLVTDGNGDGNGAQRKSDFESVMKKLKVAKYEMWDQPDNYNRPINEKTFSSYLQSCLTSHPEIQEVYTHGPLGEYGHPHHQQVSNLVHSYTWPKNTNIWHPDTLEIGEGKRISLTDQDWEIAVDIMTTNYLSEYKRFYNLLPIKKSQSYILDTGFVKEVFEMALESSTGQKKIGPYGPYQKVFNLMKSTPARPF